MVTHLRVLFHHNPNKRLFVQVDGSLEHDHSAMIFQLASGFEWKPGQLVPATAIRPLMFLSRALTKAEKRYGPSELEVACLV